MSKKAVSITLSPESLVWLRAKTLARKGRSLSETIDLLVREAANLGTEKRSIVGSLRIVSEDDLHGADESVRGLFTLAAPEEQKKKARAARARTR